MAHDPANRLLFWDERLAVDPETGRLVGMFWTHDREAGRTQRAHRLGEDARWHFVDLSDRCWFRRADPEAVAVARRSRSVRLFHRHRPPSLRAILSPDFGQTWDAAGELVFLRASVRPAGGHGCAQRGFTDYYADQRLWNFGHVEPGLLPDGRVLVAFYAGDAQSLSVRWVRLQSSLEPDPIPYGMWE